MDDNRFDALLRRLGQGVNRRAALAALAALAAGGVTEATAKRRHGQHHKDKHAQHKHAKAKPPGTGCIKEGHGRCATASDCCGGVSGKLTCSTNGVCVKPQSGCSSPADCKPNEICTPAGVCQPTGGCGTGQVRCGNACVNLQTDQANCGACGIACSDPTPACSGGTCVCTASSCGAGQTCEDGRCGATPTCFDNKKNGSETDVDCGGPVCPPCSDGKGCQSGGDCVSGVCANQVCQAPTCTDNVKNGTETDVDCGGTCSPCANGKGCGSGSDCRSGFCSAGTCQACSTAADCASGQTCLGGDCFRTCNDVSCLEGSGGCGAQHFCAPTTSDPTVAVCVSYTLSIPPSCADNANICEEFEQGQHFPDPLVCIDQSGPFCSPVGKFCAARGTLD